MTFTQYFRANVANVKYIDRRKSWLMWTIHGILKFASLFLRAFGKPPLAQGDFVGAYVTTIGRRIYASPAWSEDATPSGLMIHELTHVVQDSMLYKLRYIFSPKWRRFYETQAWHAAYMFRGVVPDLADIERQAEHLVAYGLDYIDSLSFLGNYVAKESCETGWRVLCQTPLPDEPPYIVYGAYRTWKNA